MAGLYDQLTIFSGTSNPGLADEICRHIDLPPGRIEILKFSNENIFVRIGESVRENDVFVVQSLGANVNDSIMELLIIIDTLRRSSSGRITAVLPYYAYGRTDKKDQPRVPITARLLADMITVAGADRVLTIDLHAGQIQGFFNIPVDEMSAFPILSNYFNEKRLRNPVVVSPDLGNTKRARNFAEAIDASLAVIEKRRVGNDDKSEVLNLIGSVQGSPAILVDDEIDTGGSIVQAARVCIENGATEVYACCTHGILSGSAIERLQSSPIREVVVTNTVTIPPEKRISKLKVLSVGTLIGETIQRIHTGASVALTYRSVDVVR
ncbi:MAG TPA: ribose-phosphate pyrophosphokinase [Thermomicrobiales bacterium]|jgi:ribose-phosphate pyrophosphokinase|nr:ribose-phosphate diphosphokinase [Chloroflexota bacterium]HQX62523.1 ribose-phosphate pyrophosphokinase [Thermomicrobiales bacterium]HQZ90390.1 ribose-phosphate pyrophosphokinase [Thermomicrobiales bacterium]HRA31962.1 ribose-phosphate pyrophosphokinase [Thermomicrobiales bacterium]